MRYLISLIMLLSLGLSGCSKSPLEKLASNKVYLELNNTFWASEHEHKSKLWQDALSYCKGKQNQKPNCMPVVMEYAITNGSTTAPAIGHSGNEVDVPNF